MKNIYRISSTDGQTNILCLDMNMNDLKLYINNIKYLDINEDVSIVTDKIVSIERIAYIDNNESVTILRTDEYTIKQLNNYAKSINIVG